ncbi:unnamed protein product [Rotaria sp. Silwood2]|nr:unnamed protein product [Rotaria sp. Silwood2]CAF2944545.1 unnamed protein product [Rotaria sp. Silwood2]CAF3310628.1 unnamed protein product [Rotaria sp. Silwood2]CAF3350696.1 unnamed protein product [Rotaria sp. Silwood2]CAF3934280.1 unnamed protein product [Rotaria sp. Silwood2]
MADLNPSLRIIAQPKTSYRERYLCEMDRSRNRSQRFIRAESNLDHLEYPTIEIPKQWNSQRLYVRATLVTVQSKQVPGRCIHPYPIDTSESDVIKDVVRNTLYFPISEEELNNGRKSFRIIRRKLIQHELRNYGQLSLLNTDEQDIPLTADLYNARKIIRVYQLEKSQLLFSIAERFHDDPLPVIYDVTSVYSHIMTATTETSINKEEPCVRCVPKKGCWRGGDDILMVVPKFDRRKVYQVYFECSSSNNKSQIQFEFVDMKTIAFKTPPCPIQTMGNENTEISIVVNESGEEIARVNFMYQSSLRCSNCAFDFLLDSSDSSTTNEQFSTLDVRLDGSDISMYADDLLHYVNC